MKLEFDPNQQFQLDAVASVVDLFEGQPEAEPDYGVVNALSWGSIFARHDGAVLGASNQLLLGEERLHDNLRRVQERNDILVSDPASHIESWDLQDPIDSRRRSCPQFSVEMETGTGKTYVYLRTIFELARRYGFRKFIIVVPSVAVREGVLKTLDITREHFRALYNNIPIEHFVYDGKKVNRLRHFAYGNTLQVMVINIDAFRRNFEGTEEERKGNLIYKESDKLSGRQPIEFVQATRPIVIIDEPQSVDSTEKAQEAIKALNPIFALRYSATHRVPFNLVYRLDPVRAFELGLVKQIVVSSAQTLGVTGDAFIRVERIDYKPSIRARVRILTRGADGPRERTVTVRHGSDLHFLSGEREEYRDGYSVAEINAEPGNEVIRFTNGLTLRAGAETGGLREALWRAQIRHTVRRHLEKELQERARGIKVLSLFFVDRVSNYRSYAEDGTAVKGKFAHCLEEEISQLARDPRFSQVPWLTIPMERLHNGYFAEDKNGLYRESREGRETQADDDAYALIMRDKERLLSEDEPLRFIFSHSALREGWDNPNVFQICTLNESRSPIKKRQEIGRGLRLPVDQNGRRVFDPDTNRLFVMANESYEDFARTLQAEYEEDCGVTFGKVPLSAIAKLARVKDGTSVPIGRVAATEVWSALQNQGMIDGEGRIQTSFNPRKSEFKLALPEPLSDVSRQVVDLLSAYRIEAHVKRETEEGPNRLRKEVTLGPEFQELWSRIRPRTMYRVEFSTDELVRRVVVSLRSMPPIQPLAIRVKTGKLEVERRGVVATALASSDEPATPTAPAMPDVLAYLQNETDLTRSTLARILLESGRLSEALVNPQEFLDSVVTMVRSHLRRLLVDGIQYDRLEGPDANWEMILFKSEELVDYLTSLRVKHSVYDFVAYDSEIEREFAKKLDSREDIKLFVKLPRGFQIETPVGRYNPDWAIVKQNSETLYMVRETKSTKDLLQLRSDEADKLKCGRRHFEALRVPFDVVADADEV